MGNLVFSKGPYSLLFHIFVSEIELDCRLTRVFETIAIRVKQLRWGSTFVLKSFVFYDFQILFTSCALHKIALRRLRCDIGDWRPVKQRSLWVPSVGVGRVGASRLARLSPERERRSSVSAVIRLRCMCVCVWVCLCTSLCICANASFITKSVRLYYNVCETVLFALHIGYWCFRVVIL